MWLQKHRKSIPLIMLESPEKPEQWSQVLLKSKYKYTRGKGKKRLLWISINSMYDGKET